ncbi:MAG: protein-glutamate O-methyltransferase CheR [Chthoniobacteraceae bacterium]|nr:protein-glutamate O-methyltransferase CheR [Chthoniobacteraceae bacterium]
MAITLSDFQYLQTLLHSLAGLVLETGKEYLVDSRLEPVARAEGFDTIARMIDAVRFQPVNNIHWKIVDAMTTNETSFFRDIYPFEVLRDSVLPELIALRAPQRQLTIWCCAASTGQEPYSVAILLRECFPAVANWNVRIIATDINEEVLERARAGRYRQMEVNRGLAAPLLVKYFRERAAMWEVREDIRNMVDFREMNLVQPWPFLPKCDLVLLRNVMIYFDVATKRSILGKVRTVLSPEGYLFLGNAETTMNLDDNYERALFGRVVCYKQRR